MRVYGGCDVQVKLVDFFNAWFHFVVKVFCVQSPPWIGSKSHLGGACDGRNAVTETSGDTRTQSQRESEPFPL